jgi:trehalose 6-phosphate phosphatase
MQHPPLPDDRSALFLDFDGTLADLVERPEAVRLDDTMRERIGALAERLGGAVALLSGRPIAEIDARLAPWVLPTAGVHGAERRSADGRLHHVEGPALDAARAVVEAAVAAHPGLWCEAKPGALALHFRVAPALEDFALHTMELAQRRVEGMALLRGKMVIELKPQRAGKGHALEAFLAEPPFAGRVPWVFGDDVTDEAAFDAALGRGGVAVKIGAGDTAAPYRIEGPASLGQWMQRALDGLRAALPAR